MDDLTREDIASLGWSGGRLHLVSVGRALDRVESGEIEYLVVRGPGGHPVAKVGIDYATDPGAGLLMQLATAEELQGLGIAEPEAEHCARCGVSVSAKVREYCQAHRARFGGLVNCFDHQRTFPKS